MATTETVSGPVVVQVRERGQLTIPAEIRRKMGIEEGDVFSLIQVGDTLVATRKKLVAQEVATAIEGLMREQGVALADLLDGLEKQREAYVREKYDLES